MSEPTNTQNNNSQSADTLTQTVSQTERSTIVNSAPPAPVAEAPAQPELILGKFKNIEDLQKSYVELEKKLSGKQPEMPQPKTPDEQQAKAPSSKYADLPVEVHKWQDKFVEQGGKLTDADWVAIRQEVAEGKISNQALQYYLARPQMLAQAQQSTAQAQTASDENIVLEAVGGKQGYEEVVQWAKANLGQEEIAAYNRVMQTADTATKTVFAKGLQAQFMAAEGRGAKLISGNVSGESVGYESQEQMIRDMQSKLYKTDPAERARVERKLAATRAW